jgi:ribosome assembly protein YihI (activator of Der GTPase)
MREIQQRGRESCEDKVKEKRKGIAAGSRTPRCTNWKYQNKGEEGGLEPQKNSKTEREKKNTTLRSKELVE